MVNHSGNYGWHMDMAGYKSVPTHQIPTSHSIQPVIISASDYIVYSKLWRMM